MDFEFNSEQEMLRKSFADFLSKECDHELIKSWHRDSKGYATSVWKKMADLGWMELIGESFENKERTGFMDAVILFEELGKALLPSPLFASAAMAGSILAQTKNGDKARSELNDILAGKKVFTAALINESGDNDHLHPQLEALRGTDGKYRLNGVRLLVPYADSAHYVLVCADLRGSDGGPTLFKIDTNRAGFSVTPMESLYPERKCVVKLENVSLDKSDIVGKIGHGGEIIETVMGLITLLKCAEMLGGMNYIMNTTVQYVKERHQFGKPLGVHQSIQHDCADMATLYEGARMTTYLAAQLIDEGATAEKEISMAKAWISDGYKKCTWIAQQLHGAIGFTEEYPIHLYYRHAKESELMFGDSRYHRSKLAAQMGM